MSGRLHGGPVALPHVHQIESFQRTLMASRMEARLTLNSIASSRSGGSLFSSGKASVEKIASAKLLCYIFVNAPPDGGVESRRFLRQHSFGSDPLI